MASEGRPQLSDGISGSRHRVHLLSGLLPGGEPGIHTERASGRMPRFARPATGPLAPVP